MKQKKYPTGIAIIKTPCGYQIETREGGFYEGIAVGSGRKLRDLEVADWLTASGNVSINPDFYASRFSDDYLCFSV
jgi:hypothetical protein